MSRCRNLISGLLVTILCANVHSTQYADNMFLNGQYQNEIQSHPVSAYRPSNIFFDHAIISRQASPFTGPTYLPPKDYLKCAIGQQCVRKDQCQSGYFTQQQPNIRNCEPETNICCTYRAPPTVPTPKPYVTCPRDSDCVSPRDCRSGEITAVDYVKRTTTNTCYAPEVCCRMPSTTLTSDGYILHKPDKSFPLPTNPTLPAEQPTQPIYRPQPTQPAYRPQPTQPTPPAYRPQPTQPTPPAYRPQPVQPTQPAYRPQPTQPPNEYLPPQPTQQPRQTQPPRPQPTQPAYRPQPTQPAYRPQPTQPAYRPQPTQPAYRPQPTQPPYRPSKPNNEYLPPVSTNEVTPRQPQPQQPQPQPRPQPQPQQPQPQPRPQPQPQPRPQPQPQPRPPTQYQPQPQPQPRPQPQPQPQQPFEYDRIPQPSNERPVTPPRPVPNRPTSKPQRGEGLLSPQIFPNIPQVPGEIPKHYAKCASALLCTDVNYCNAIGTITDTPVNLSPREAAFRVPLTDCQIPDSGAPGKCCRDSNYVDPWPVNLAGVCASRNRNTKPAGIKDIDANFAEIPWQAMVLKESTKSLLCGGAIIGDEFVLTSASCIQGVSVADLRIKAGEWELGSTLEPLPFQLVGAKTVDLHPEFNPSTGANDMAIIRLQKRLEFATHIQPICISDEDPSPSEQCVTTGWGKQALSIHEEGAIMHVTSTSPLARSDCGADGSSVCSATKFDSCEFDAGSALACGTGSGVRLKGVFTAENACGENQGVRFSKPDVKWINTAFADRNKPLLLKRF